MFASGVKQTAAKQYHGFPSCTWHQFHNQQSLADRALASYAYMEAHKEDRG